MNRAMLITAGAVLSLSVAWFGSGGVAAMSQAVQVTGGTPTFSKDVAPIVYNRCVSCHRPGEAAPMSLIKYPDVRPWAASMRRMVVSRQMPPWTADPEFGKFRHEARLTDAEVQTISRWAAAGAPEGNAADLPALPKFTEGWQIGKPDIVLEMPVAFEIPVSGEIPYQYFEVPTNFTEDRWIQAAEVRYGDAPHVHHIIVSVIPPANRVRQLESVVQNRSILQPGETPAPRARGNTGRTEEEAAAARRIGALPLVNKALGEEPPIFPEGTGRLIPAGSTLLFQMHYTSNGVAGSDRSRVGLIFAKTKPRYEVRQTAVTNNQFTIPPGATNHRVEGEGTFTKDVEVLSVHGHMHLRGKDMTYIVTYPDGRSETIFRIPRWDYLWQQEFWLEQPLHLPKGSKLRVIAHFDNSSGNPINPDPKATLTWGDQTWEEMMGGFIQYIVRDDVASGRSTAP